MTLANDTTRIRLVIPVFIRSEAPEISRSQRARLRIAQSLLATNYIVWKPRISVLGQLQGSVMLKPEPFTYVEHIIRDADSYGAVLSEADLEISQIEPGCLSGRHVRFGLPGGQFSYVETTLALRGNGTFSNRWTLSVVLESTTRQHGIAVRPGSLVIHRPNVEHDAVYGRNFKVACFSVHDEVLAKHFQQLDPQVRDAMRRPWSVFEPPDNSRRETIEHFAEAAAIIRFAPQVRKSRTAVAKFEEELVRDFLETVEQQFPAHPIEADRRATAMVRQVDEDVRNSLFIGSSVAELCSVYDLPRRTVNRAFQNALGMGPATYLRRIRLNAARRALQERKSATVTDVALEFGFWHLGRFAEQYNKLFGESPHKTLHRADTGIGAAQLWS
jgi:AraC-like DNA-binding protein